jgi:hypothetical protein
MNLAVIAAAARANRQQQGGVNQTLKLRTGLTGALLMLEVTTRRWTTNDCELRNSKNNFVPVASQ